MACMGELSAANRKTIHQYWSLISSDPDGYNLSKELDDRFASIFSEAILTEIPSYMQRVAPQINLHGDVPLEGLSKSLYAALYAKEEQLRKGSAAQSEKEQIKTEYLILQGRLMGPTLINMTLRKMLEDRVREKEAYVENMLHSLVLPIYKRDIEEYQRGIEELQKGPGAAWEKLLKEAREMGKEEVVKSIEEDFEYDKRRRAEALAELAELQGRDNKAYAYSLCGTHPDEIRKLIPKDTQYEKMVRDLFGVDPELIAKKRAMALAPDLQLDLSKLADPVSHFLKEMHTEAAQKLKVLYSQKVKIEVAS